MVPNPGGVLIRDAAGKVIGACRHFRRYRRTMTRSCAVAGIKAAGLKADPGGTKK